MKPMLEPTAHSTLPVSVKRSAKLLRRLAKLNDGIVFVRDTAGAKRILLEILFGDPALPIFELAAERLLALANGNNGHVMVEKLGHAQNLIGNLYGYPNIYAYVQSLATERRAASARKLENIQIAPQTLNLRRENATWRGSLLPIRPAPSREVQVTIKKHRILLAQQGEQ